MKAGIKGFDGGREDEDAHGVREFFAHLARALPVDFKENVLARGHLLLDPYAARAVVIAVHERGFQEFALGLAFFKFRHGQKVIFAAVDFTGSRITGRMGNGEEKVGFLRQKRVHERAFAGARRCRHHEESSGMTGGSGFFRHGGAVQIDKTENFRTPVIIGMHLNTKMPATQAPTG